MNRAVFLDRDGVISRVVWREGRPRPPSSIEELEFLPRVAEAVDALREGGFRIIVVTNQPDVTTGSQRREVVEAIHKRIRSVCQVDDIKVCYHVDGDDCTCRKPKPGMLLEAAKEWSVNLDRSFMVGDRWRDIGAGRAAGCKTILVGDGYGELQPEKADAVVNSLFDAALIILSDGVGAINDRTPPTEE